MSTPTRPVHLSLLRFRFPVTAVASIAHRVSGVLLFLALPWFIHLFELTASGAQGRQAVAQMLEPAGMRLLLLAMLWALAHHVLAGVRFLLLDMEVGSAICKARVTAWAVNAGALVITAVGAWLLL